MKNKEYVFFWGGIYSNWYRSKFTLDGKTYNCAEQYMMEQKALTFGDTESAEKIMGTENPREQKALGRKVKNYNQKKWDEVKFEIVKRGCRAKFEQNHLLKRQLILDKDKEIVEASPEDRIWGIGFTEDDALQNMDKWGENLLGKLLMELAQELKFNDKDRKIYESLNI